MKSSPTGNIQETIPCRTTIPVNDVSELFRFRTVILHGKVDSVVILGCLGKHGSPLLPPCIGHQFASHCKPITAPHFCPHVCSPSWFAQQGWWRMSTSKKLGQHDGEHQQI